MSSQANNSYEFGPFRLNLAERRLLRGGRTVPLAPKVYDTLLLLVENCGRTLGKDEMMRLVWPDSFVEESSLTQNIFQLRKALREDAEESYIATISKRGYCFVADVRRIDGITSEGRRANQGEGKPWASRIGSLAVLPFKPLGTDRKNELMGLGMADALILKLSNLQQVKVLPTSAISTYGDRKYNSLEVGRELRVDAVLDGTAQHVDDRMRVTVQLLSINDGRTLWSGKFDEHFTDIFFLQDSISEKVAEAIIPCLTGEERRQLAKRYTNNTDAYQTYLLGLYFSNKGTKESLEEAIQYLCQTVEKDPDYALAHAVLADCYFMRLDYDRNAVSVGATYEKIRATAIKALELDATLAEAHTALAVVKIKNDRNPIEAETSFERAIAANQNCAMAYRRYSWFLAAMGRLGEALQKARAAQEINALSPENNACLGDMLYFARRYDEALHYNERALIIEPNFFWARLGLGLNYEQKGMYDEALKEFQTVRDSRTDTAEPLELLGHAYATLGQQNETRRILTELHQLSERTEVASHNIAAIYAALGETDRAFEWLQKPCVNWTQRLRKLRFDPRLDVLRLDPRFATAIEIANQ